MLNEIGKKMNSRNGEWDWFDELFNHIFGHNSFFDDEMHRFDSIIEKAQREEQLKIEDKEKEMIVSIKIPNITEDDVVYNKAKNLLHIQVIRGDETIFSKDIITIFDLDKIKTVKIKKMPIGVDVILKKPKSARDVEVEIK